jgi:hypothetical protein
MVFKQFLFRFLQHMNRRKWAETGLHIRTLSYFSAQPGAKKKRILGCVVDYQSKEVINREAKNMSVSPMPPSAGPSIRATSFRCVPFLLLY